MRNRDNRPTDAPMVDTAGGDRGRIPLRRVGTLWWCAFPLLVGSAVSTVVAAVAIPPDRPWLTGTLLGLAGLLLAFGVQGVRTAQATAGKPRGHHGGAR